ncbi:MAG: response regulator [Actinomycetia bacterium]|nr:response regulator [Actinomycetes bacterium]
MILRTVATDGLLRVNRTFVDRLGLEATDLETEPFLSWIHPDDRDALSRVAESGQGEVTARHRTASGNWESFDWEIRVSAGMPVALGLLEQAEARGDQPHPPSAGTSGPSLTRTLEHMALIVEAKNPGLKCSILLVDDESDTVTVGAGPSLPAEYNAAVQGLEIGPGVGSCGTAAFWNVPVVVENIGEDPLWVDLRDEAENAGVAACWSHPITSEDGKVLGAMALYSTEPSAPATHHMDGLEIAAQMVGMAIERDGLETQLRQASKTEAIGVLAGGIAHDFNNLLAVVLGNAELAQDTVAPDDTAQELLGGIVNASLEASELCSQMLAYAGRGALSTETVEVNSLVRNLGGLLGVTMSKKAHLHFELSDQPLAVQADRIQLGQVIMNLITNASEAIGDNEGQVRLSTRSLSADSAAAQFPRARLADREYVQLTVHDTGIGMTESTQTRIFDPFFTTKPAGRGLGLAAVHGVVRAHDGVIVLDSVDGQGTSFTVLLPRVPTVLGRAGQPAATGGSPQARVLLADDEPDVRRTLALTLESAGYEVVEAADGQEAVDLFREMAGSIDCVLLDLNMPGLSGDEVFPLLKQIRPEVPVILSSGFTEQEMLERFQGAGLAGIVHKPARAQVLLAALADALAQPAHDHQNSPE